MKWTFYAASVIFAAGLWTLWQRRRNSHS